MPKLVGPFINPENNKEDYVDISLVGALILEDDTINILGDNEKHYLKYKLEYDNKSNVLLKGQIDFTYQNKEYNIKKELLIPENEFSKNFADIVYNNIIFESSDYFLEKQKTLKNIFTKELINKNIFLSDTILDQGIGFVFDDKNRKIMTIENINIDETNTKDIIITINNCIGYNSLKDINNPKISYYYDNNEFKAEIKNIESDNESGIFKTYDIIIESFSIIPNNIKIDYKKYDTDTDIETEDEIEQFNKDRLSLLDKLDIDIEIENMFDDLF